MCAYQAKDGKRFENQEIGRHYDKSRGHEPKAEKKEKSEPAEREGSDEPIEEVVKAHGPAHETHIEKSEDEGEQYSVHSTHEDGHKHSSHGHTLEEAHEHSMKAHGAEGMEGEEPEPEGSWSDAVNGLRAAGNAGDGVMASQKDAGTSLTGFVTASESEPPRRCDNCEHFRRGLKSSGWCDGEKVMRDPELKDRRNTQGLVRVEPDAYCWWFESK